MTGIPALLVSLLYWGLAVSTGALTLLVGADVSPLVVVSRTVEVVLVVASLPAPHAVV